MRRCRLRLFRRERRRIGGLARSCIWGLRVLVFRCFWGFGGGLGGRGGGGEWEGGGVVWRVWERVRKMVRDR